MAGGTTKETVLLIGARGYLGSQVLDAVLSKGKYDVQALIREGSNASKIEAKGVTIVRGDMMDKDSLNKAISDGDVDVVINTANGYGSGHPEIDVEGANNIVDAIVEANNKSDKNQVRRYIYCSVLACDKAQTVEHFWNKKLHEDYIRSSGINFVALRPGAFLDQTPDSDYLGDSVSKNQSFTVSVWDKTVPIGMIYTKDLAEYFAKAIEIDAKDDESKYLSIDLGWTKPVTYEEVISIMNNKLNRNISCYALPNWFRLTLIYTVGSFSNFWKEMFQMFTWFGQGDYVNTVELQTKYLGGNPPTPEDAIGRWLDEKILTKK